MVINPTVEDDEVLATDGNLVFQGRGDGLWAAYRATDAKEMWTFDAGTGMMASPVTYAVDGAQYQSLMGAQAMEYCLTLFVVAAVHTGTPVCSSRAIRRPSSVPTYTLPR